MTHSTPQPPSAGQKRFLWYAITGLSVATLIALICTLVWGLGILLDVLGPVIWPLAVAAVVACLLSPVVDWLERRKVSRTKAILLVFVASFLVVAGVLGSIIPQVVVETQELIKKVPEYSVKLQHRVVSLMAQPPEFLKHFLPASTTPAGAAETKPEAKNQSLDSAISLMTAKLPGIGSWLYNQKGRVASGFGILAGLALVPVYAFYFLQEQRRIEGHWKDYLPVQDSRVKDEVVFVLEAVNRYMIAFFRGQVLVAICDSILYTIGFLVCGLNYAFLLGFASVLLSMIPFLGAIVLCIASLTLALVQFGDWLHPVMVLASFAVVQTLEGLVISPKIIGDRVGLHPLVIIVAVMAGTTLLGGILGGILAIPLAAALRVILFRYVWKVR